MDTSYQVWSRVQQNIFFEGQDKFYCSDPISKIKKGGGEGIEVISTTPSFIHRR
jgi:hypothetical protein